MTLSKTAQLMLNEDYKLCFRAEYWQTKIRYNRLHKMIIKMEANTLDFKPDCPYELLVRQARAMGEYLHALEIRAEIERIDLKEAEDDAEAQSPV